MSNDLVYSFDGEDFSYDCIDEAIDARFACWGCESFNPGDDIIISVGKAVRKVPSDFFGEYAVLNLLEQAQCQAEDECGDWAEDLTHCSKEAQEELETLIDSWANRNLKCNFYTVQDIKELKVTLEHKHFD